MQHVKQFPDDGPNWCRHCGEFTPFYGKCTAQKANKFDARKRTVRRRMMADLLGVKK